MLLHPIHQIVQGLKKMSKVKRNGMQVLFKASYLNAKKGCPYSDFSDWIEWAKLQGLKLSVHRVMLSILIKFCLTKTKSTLHR